MTFFCIAESVPRAPLLYSAGIVIIGQGHKVGYLGDRTFKYDAETCLVLGVPVPFECEAHATPAEPLLGIRIDIDLPSLHSLVARLRGRLGLEDRHPATARLGVEPVRTSGTVHELTADTHPIQREFFNFYRTPRGEVTPSGSSPELTTHPTLTSNVKFMNFYPFADIETISPRPMLFITGANAHSREFSEDVYRLAGQPKELFIVPDAGHVDLYDRVTLIPWDRLQSFFAANLKRAPASATGEPRELGNHEPGRRTPADGAGGDHGLCHLCRRRRFGVTRARSTIEEQHEDQPDFPGQDADGHVDR